MDKLGHLQDGYSMGKVTQLFANLHSEKPAITICSPKDGFKCQSGAVRKALCREIERLGLDSVVGEAKTGCAGSCLKGPFLGFPEKQFFYIGVKPESAPEIIRETIANGRTLFSLVSLAPERSFRPDIFFENESGVIIALDSDVCMVEVVGYFLAFQEKVSCGKCVPCRIGIRRMKELVWKIGKGSGTVEDIDQLQDLCETMQIGSHCDFAATGSRPVASILSYFEEEFLRHVEKKECPADVCKGLKGNRSS
jgi:(2Fe-2S) ferredoxin